MVRPGGFEPPTSWFVAMRSIQLIYGRTPKRGAPCQTSPTLASGFSIQPKNPSIPQKKTRFARQAKRYALVILQQAFLLVDEV